MIGELTKDKETAEHTISTMRGQIKGVEKEASQLWRDNRGRLGWRHCAIPATRGYVKDQNSQIEV